MINTLNQSTELPRLTKTKFLVILAITGVGIAATLSHADSDGNPSDHKSVAGTWMHAVDEGQDLLSFMSDGRMMTTGPLNIATGNGPGGIDELDSPAPGEWVRTGNGEFTTTSYSVLSSPPVGSAHRVKLASTFALDKSKDELTLIRVMITVFLPDGTPQFPPFPGTVPQHYERVVAGQ